jgi:hypothetical protein
LIQIFAALSPKLRIVYMHSACVWSVEKSGATCVQTDVVMNSPWTASAACGKVMAVVLSLYAVSARQYAQLFEHNYFGSFRFLHSTHRAYNNYYELLRTISNIVIRPQKSSRGLRLAYGSRGVGQGYSLHALSSLASRSLFFDSRNYITNNSKGE